MVASVTFAVAAGETPGVDVAIAVAGSVRQAATSASTQAQLRLGHARALGARITDVSKDAAMGRVRGPGIPLPLSARPAVSLNDARSAPTPHQHDRK